MPSNAKRSAEPRSKLNSQRSRSVTQQSLSREQLELLLLGTWEDESYHQTNDRHRWVLDACDAELIERYLAAHSSEAGRPLDHDDTQRLAAVCAARNARPEQVLACVRRVLDAPADDDGGYPAFYEVLPFALPRLGARDVGKVLDELGVFDGSQSHYWHAQVLTASGTTMPARHLGQTLALARRESTPYRQQIIESIAGRLTADEVREAIRIARGIEDDYVWSDAVTQVMKAAGIEGRRQVAISTWPLRPDAPYGKQDAFSVAARELPPRESRQMIEALLEELDGVDPPADHVLAKVLLAAVESGRGEVAAWCAGLAVEHDLLFRTGLLRALVRWSDARLRADLMVQVLDRTQDAGFLSDAGILDVLIDVLPQLEVDELTTLASSAAFMPVRLLIALAESWPEDALDEMSGVLLPWARRAAPSDLTPLDGRTVVVAEPIPTDDSRRDEPHIRPGEDDPECTAMRAIAERCGGSTRQQLVEEMRRRSFDGQGVDQPERARGGAPSAPEVPSGPQESAADPTARDRTESLLEDEIAPDVAGTAVPTSSSGQVITAIRRGRWVGAAARWSEVMQLIARVAGGLSETDVSGVLTAISTVPNRIEQIQLATALAPAMTPSQARYALRILPASGGTGNGFRDEGPIVEQFVRAFKTIALRLDSAESLAMVDLLIAKLLLRAPHWDDPPSGPGLLETDGYDLPYWVADVVAELLPHTSDKGQRITLGATHRLGEKPAAHVLLAIAQVAEDVAMKAVATAQAEERIDKVRRGIEKVRMLIQLADMRRDRAGHLLRGAIAAAEGCSTSDNERSRALLEVAMVAPTDIAVEALTSAVLAYDHSHWAVRRDSLRDKFTECIRRLGLAADDLVADVIHAARTEPRERLLSRVALIGEGAGSALGQAWADKVAIDLTNARSWWP